MRKESEKKIKYCVFCGANIEKDKIYCPNCGKLVIKLEPGKKITQPKPIQELEISRKCSNCGSIITSTILDQCPICNTSLEKVSEIRKTIVQKKPSLIFTNKKLELEQKFVLRKDTWNLKEGLNVFGTCIYILVIVFFLLITFISFQLDSTPITIQQILLSQIPELVFGIYPIWYIYNKRHSFTKLGFRSDSKKFILAILIGILGSLMLIVLEFFSDAFINFIADVGLDFFNVKSNLEEQNLVIKNSDLIWIVLLTITLIVTAISSEVVFRGVLHNTLKQKFNKNYLVILLVALVYSLILLLFSFPYGVSFFLLNFLASIVLGLLYEMNGNLYNTIMANIFYSILVVILIYI